MEQVFLVWLTNTYPPRRAHATSCRVPPPPAQSLELVESTKCAVSRRDCSARRNPSGPPSSPRVKSRRWRLAPDLHREVRRLLVSCPLDPQPLRRYVARGLRRPLWTLLPVRSGRQ